MIKNLRHQSYLHLLAARVSTCDAIEENDRDIPSVRSERDNAWMIGRGSEVAKKLIQHDPAAGRPLELIQGGQMELYVRIRPCDGYRTEITTYRVAIHGLPDNRYGLKSARYDWSAKQQPGDGWDEELADNPKHPLAHLHLNFLPPGDRNCRLPTEPVCPVLLICALNHWYCTTFGS